MPRRVTRSRSTLFAAAPGRAIPVLLVLLATGATLFAVFTGVQAVVAVLLFAALLAWAVMALVRGRAGLGAAVLLLLVVGGATLLAYDRDSRAAGTFTVNIATAPQPPDPAAEIFSFWNNTYNGAKEALQGFEDGGEVTIVYAKSTNAKLVGLPNLAGAPGSATASYDDATSDLTIIFDTTYLGQSVRVLVSAKWATATTDFDPELAVVLSVPSVDLSALSDSFDEFPVRFVNALVGFANVDHTLTESATLGTTDFFEDGILDSTGPADNSFRILPNGAGLQAVLDDHPTQPDPMVEAAELLGVVDKIVIRGTVGKITGGDDDPDTNVLDLTATVSTTTPAALAEAGVALDASWSLQVKAETQGENVTFLGQLSGKARLTVDETERDFNAALSVKHTKEPQSTVFTLTGSVNNADNLFGQEWFDLKEFKVTATLSHDASKSETAVSMAMSAAFTIAPTAGNPINFAVAFSVKVNATTGAKDASVSFSLAGGDSGLVKITDVLGLFNAQVHSGLQVELTNLGIHVAVSAPATGDPTLTIVATGGASFLGTTCGGKDYPAGQANLLFRVVLGGATTPVLVGASVKGLNIKSLSCDIPFEWQLPDVLLLVTSANIDSSWSSVDAPTKGFLQNYFCGSLADCETLQRALICEGGSTCAAANQKLKVDAGLAVHATVTLPQEVTDALEELEINVTGPLRVTGRVPLFGGTGDVSLAIALPTINPGADSIIDSATIQFKIGGGTGGVKGEMAGQIDFRVQRADQTACGDAPRFGGTGPCYDVLDTLVTIGIAANAEAATFELSVSAFAGEWKQAFGVPNLTINSFVLDVTIKAQAVLPGATISFGMKGSICIGGHPTNGCTTEQGTDLLLAFSVAVGTTPPRIELEGFTVGSARGISLRDIVLTFAPETPPDALPPALSLKNLWLSFGTVDKPGLCISKGFFISAELHLNDPNPGSGVGTSRCDGGTLRPLECGAGTSCLAGIQVEISPSRFFLHGIIAEFDLGPLAFQQTEIKIDISLLKQEIYFQGGATLYDPVAYYLSESRPRVTVWASAYARLLVKQDAGKFRFEITGCALVGGTGVAGPNCPETPTAVLRAYLDAKLAVNFAAGNFDAVLASVEGEITVEVSAPGLQKLLDDIDEGLKPVGEFFDDAGVALESTAAEVSDGFCRTFNADCAELNVTADAYKTAPAYIDAQIEATDKAIKDNWAVNTWCFFTDITNITGCVDGYRTQARTANEARIAFEGGRAYIALHGINATGFGGIGETILGNWIWHVNPTKFVWPGGTEKALCAAGGTLEGFQICSIPKGQPLVLDSVITPALLQALQQIDPDIVALFVINTSQPQVAASMSLAQTTATVDPIKFTNAVRKISSTFDLNKPLSVCQSKATIRFGPNPGATNFETKIDAYGAKAIINADPGTKSNGESTLDQKALKTGVIKDVLDDNLKQDLECPVATVEGPLTFSMSAGTINEGSAVTLTGTATPGVTVTVSWGDGSSNSTATASTTGAWTASHTYLDGPKVFVIRATAADAPEAASLITVNNVAPTITGVTPPASANEGDEVTLSGTYTDPGTLDTHTLRVNWGDGTTTTHDLAAGGSSFSVTHTYVDDNPTGTPEDTHTLAITLTDKDKGVATNTTTTVLVKNVAPSDLTLSSATWSGGTAETDSDGNLIVPEGVAVTFTGTFRDPGTADTHSVAVKWGTSEPTVPGLEEGGEEEPPGEESQPEPDGITQTAIATRDATDPTLWHFSFTRIFADDHPESGTPSDLLQLFLVVSDDDGGSASLEDLAIRLQNVAPELDATPASQSIQYSDPIGTITLTASDVKGYSLGGGLFTETLTASTRWRLDAGEWQDGLFDDLVLTPGNCGDSGSGAATRQACTWSVSGLVNVAPGVYTIQFVVVDDDTGESTFDVELVVLPEDARVDYIGPTVVSAPSVLSGSIAVELRTMVRDISVVPAIEPPDLYPGDIRNATVTFVDRATGASLCTAQVVEAFPGDTTTGVAICTATLSTAGSGDSWTFDIGIVAGGWYIRDDAADNVELLVRRPNRDGIHGNHFINTVAPIGTTAPTAGTRVTGNVKNVQFSQDFGSIGTEIEVSFTSGGRSYRATVTSIDSLGVLKNAGPDSNLIEVEARVTLYDVTDKKNTIVVGAGLRLQLRYFDISAPGTPDTMAFIIWDPSGLIVAGAHWDTVTLSGIVLAGGQIMVK